MESYCNLIEILVFLQMINWSILTIITGLTIFENAKDSVVKVIVSNSYNGPDLNSYAF